MWPRTTMLALVPSTGLGAVTGGGGPPGWVTACDDGWSSASFDGGGGPPCSKIRCRWARRSMLARRYAAAALGVYDLGNVGGGVGLATPPLSPFIMSRSSDEGPDTGYVLLQGSATRGVETEHAILYTLRGMTAAERTLPKTRRTQPRAGDDKSRENTRRKGRTRSLVNSTPRCTCERRERDLLTARTHPLTRHRAATDDRSRDVGGGGGTHRLRSRARGDRGIRESTTAAAVTGARQMP